MALSAPLRVTAPVLAVVDGIPTTTSVEVAKHFGKRHDDVLRRIRNLLEQLPADHHHNFAEMVYEVPIQGARNFAATSRQDPAYRISRDGFTLLAMGFTGKKALAFKLAYIDAFNRMESAQPLLGNPAAMQIQGDCNPAPVVADLHNAITRTAGYAVAVGLQVQMTVIDMMASGNTARQVDADLHQHRWLLSFDANGKALVTALAPDTLVLPKAELVNLMADITATSWNNMCARVDGQIKKKAANA